MRYLVALSLLTAFLGGCAIVPLGHGYHGDGYYGDGYSRGHGYYRGDRHHRDDGYYRGYRDRSYGDQDRRR